MKNISNINIFLILFLLITGSCDDESWENYEPPAGEAFEPIITSISPDTGLPGSQVTITGSHLIEVDNLMFGGVEVTDFKTETTRITFAVPETMTAGVHSITATNEGGSAAVDFTVLEKLPPVDVTLKIMSFGIYNSRANLNDVAALIEKHNPDLVVLREIDSYNTRTDATIDQGQVVADQLGMNYYFASGWSYREGEYGPSLLSRFEITESQSTVLPVGPEYGGQERPFGWVTVQVQEGFDLVFATVHLDDGSNASRRAENLPLQASEILDIFSNEGRPVILGGNFYFESQSDPHLADILYSEFIPGCTGCALTYPASDPNFVADHIMFREGSDVKMEVVSYTVGEEIMNNRKPVFAEIKITR